MPRSKLVMNSQFITILHTSSYYFVAQNNNIFSITNDTNMQLWINIDISFLLGFKKIIIVIFFLRSQLLRGFKIVAACG